METCQTEESARQKSDETQDDEKEEKFFRDTKNKQLTPVEAALRSLAKCQL